MMPDAPEAGEIVVVRYENGTYRCEGNPPEYVAFSAEALEALAVAGPAWWATLTDGVVTMRVQPDVLRYRLTGDTDLTGGFVARRVDADGAPYRAGE